MHIFRRFLQRLFHAFRPERAEPDLAREVASHLTLLEDEFVGRGMTRDQAYTEARKTLGGTEIAKHEHRDARSFRWLDELLIDMKYAVRRLRGRPGTTALAVVMLAVAVGLSTAMFTIVDALIVRPLPFPHAERLTGLYMGGESGGNTYVSARVINAWRESPGFERVEGMAPASAVVETAAGPVSHQIATVTPGLFDLLGARPLGGRLFDRDAAELDALVVSETLWRTAFDADAAIVGRIVRLDGQPYVVVGVLPASFRFPEWNTSAWRARELAASDDGRTQVVARVAAGVPESDAFRMATGLAHAVEPSTSDRFARKDELIWAPDPYYEKAVPFLAGAVMLVVVVLCANVSSLLLTRLRARRREFGVCAALGASRARLLRQTSVESAITGGFGALAGVALAWSLVSLAASLLPQPFLRASLNPLDLDARAMLVAVAIGFGATFAAGMVPVWLATRVQRGAGNSLSERGGTDSRAGRRAVRGLLVAEVAVACLLLVGAALLVRSFLNVSAIDRGFDPRGLVTLWFSFEETGITEPEARRLAADEIRSAMLALPGVADVAWSTDEGLRFGPWTSDLPGASEVRLVILATGVDPSYFHLHGIELLRGRPFSEVEDPDAVIIGERIADALWPGIDPTGHTFEWAKRQVRVVGVVREPRQSLASPDRERADMFVPFDGQTRRYAWLSLRCQVACPSEGVFRVRTAEATRAGLLQATYHDDVFARDLEQPRASAALVLTFAVVALIASAGGLFGVLSYAVQERRREFGIRSALGATPAAIAKVVYREGVLVGTLGLLIGGVLAAALASTLASLSYEAAASDPVNVAVVIVTLAATILLALWRPARTAARTDPAMLLKEE